MLNKDVPVPDRTAPPCQARIPISLVDDDPEERREMQLLLRASHYDVRAYATAEALLADPRSQNIACLISDMAMRDIDGSTLLRRLRDGGWLGPAILMTSSRNTGLASRALSDGFHAVLVKPIADRIILAAVNGAVNLEPREQKAHAR